VSNFVSTYPFSFKRKGGKKKEKKTIAAVSGGGGGKCENEYDIAGNYYYQGEVPINYWPA